MISSAIYPTNDLQIRNALKKKLGKEFSDEASTKIVEEFGIHHGEVRADVAVINGKLHGYELKSDLDTFNRLPNQIKYYNLIFDEITLVVGKTHIHKAIYTVPDWWGIKLAKINKKNRVQFIQIREANQNTSQNNHAIAQLLRKEEIISVLAERGVHKGLSSKSCSFLYQVLIENFSFDDLKNTVRTKLKDRFST